jgi:hypothetical protein
VADARHDSTNTLADKQRGIRRERQGDGSGIGAVVVHQLSALAWALRDKPIYLADYLVLYGDAAARARIRAALVPLFGHAQGVEDVDDGNVQPAAKLYSHPARHPEVAVDEVILDAFASGVGHERVAEPGHVRPELIFGHESCRPGVQVDDTHAWRPLGDIGDVGAIAACKHAYGKVTPCQVAAELVHVDVPSPGVYAAQQRDRAGVLAEEAMRAGSFTGRAELLISADHVELWPVGLRTAASGGDAVAASAVIGLPAEVYREAVVIDRAGRLQLSEEALERVPFGRHAAVRIAGDHVELWPLGVA